MVGRAFSAVGAVFVVLALFFVLPAPAAAQEGQLVERCRGATATADDAAFRVCNLVAQVAVAAQAPIGLSASGGNPVPGTASTLGMRLGSLPRVSVAGRVTAARARVPNVLELGNRGDFSFFIPSLNVDAALGVTQGFSPFPTVGGVGSLDLIGSAGFVFLPGGSGWDDGSVFSIGIGTRLGILRESFVLPGISASLMYRRTGSATFGDRSLDSDDAFVDLGISNWSLRGAVGKRILGVSLTAGAGYDWYSSDVDWGFVNPSTAGPSVIEVSYDGFDQSRAMLFGNITYTFLVLHLVGELGWQSGPEMVPGPLPDTRYRTGGGFFGSLAARLSI